jgi:RNAse (barnase) inhibitor barstar
VITIVGPDAQVGLIVRAAREAGAQVFVVPGGRDRDESYDWFARELDLPVWFGRNLDALADCLHELADSPLPEPTTRRHLVWDGVAQLREADRLTYEGIVGVLDEVSEDHPGFDVTVVDR